MAALFSFLTVGCGGSGGDDPKALCMQGCSKAKMCLPPQISASINCDEQCKDPTTTGGGCKNQDEIVAKAKSCLDMACDQFLSCGMTLPKCQPTGTSTADGGR